MKDSVFVDASAWVAIINRRDAYHQAAATVYRQLLRDKAPLFTTNWAAYEALSILKGRVGYEAAERLWSVLNDVRLVRLVRVGRALEDRGLEMFFRYRDKAWGVVDCASLVLMRQVHCRRAFAFDTHFREAGRQSGFEVVPDI
ncbi:MAG: type II toxin-antitoxin system VapC family toxin [Desulfotomaculales bacterium]